MAVSNIKISDTINWAKRLYFNHNPVIGNSLEPALTSANLVIADHPRLPRLSGGGTQKI